MRQDRIHNFVTSQLSSWTLASDNFKALEKVHACEMEIGGLMVRLQHNPARMISSAAKLTKADIAARKCFLCQQNRPQEQIYERFVPTSGNEYHILVNPYPIFPDHLVVAMASHTDQSILGRYGDMLELTAKAEGCTVFYNGPCCGASAPDHHHFQVVPGGHMPLIADVDARLSGSGDDPVLHSVLDRVSSADLYHYRSFARGIFVIRSRSVNDASLLFDKLLAAADMPEGDSEPRINLYSWFDGDEYRSVVFFRKCHRSHHYFSDGPDHLTMSPGCADMGGVFIVPVKEEYDRITPRLMAEMIDEVCIDNQEQDDIIGRLARTQPLLEVGVMGAEEIEFEIFSDGRGPRKAVLKNGMIEYDGQMHRTLSFPAPPSRTRFAAPAFALYGVTIGVRFHWQRTETQQFAGDLRIIVDGNRLRAVNVIGVEDYLLSVISSEMSSSASEEFLKAHAVISRSWVLRRMLPVGKPQPSASVDNLPKLVTWLYSTREVAVRTADEYVKWYDHQDHKLFHVCADDHCQRYQGLTRAVGDTVRRAIDKTWGQVLRYEGEICDARFSKSCGGVMETFSTCWQDKDYPYLQPLPDTPGHDPEGECFCSMADKDIIAQVLNSYDRETVDFYRWTEEYDPEQLGEIIERKFGVMTGPVLRLEPLQRGPSGRISLLRITGQLQTIVVGKELEIRRILSQTHLKSSAFDVEYSSGKIILHGIGWGHGVGMCQIGAAVMAAKGYDYRQILEHYYPGAEV